ncbi:MAG: tRNA (adenosine(37)-N6)-threonylcarbamoyltransferase complex dimerization subunit type 1 TsaB [Candidatus Ancaeobacter aquaticus]|nr:tRNA (adenosine(37)-N6)-threonylcarbamoyltransferase complex dimerization subunit type 1 TsaB [Candidatus Ancaeobacter aquaticus]
MNVLGIETSTNQGSIAIVSAKKLIKEITISKDCSHSRNLVNKVDTLLGKQKLTLNDIDIVVVGRGPGSFTGIRIGAAFVQGVQTALTMPTYGVSAFDNVAYEIGHCPDIDLTKHAYVVVLFDARRDEYYCRIFKNEKGKLIQYKKDSIVTLGKLKRYYKNALFVGPDVSQAEALGLEVYIREPKASRSALLIANATKKNLREYQSIEPIYLRKTQAEERRLEALKKKKKEC